MVIAHKKIKGQINQMAFLVTDLNQAMEYYGKLLMVRQWYRPVSGKEDVICYKDKILDSDGMDLILGYYGNMEIELIVPPRQESMYSKYLEKHGPGFNHICFHVKNLEKALSYYEDLGFEVIQHGLMKSAITLTRYAYITGKEQPLDQVIELSESRLFGWIPFVRGKKTVLAGSLFGMAEKIRPSKEKL